ncbi:MAG TPA: hypothetical protein VKY15_07040 [Acidimicrobiales bacterium]|jgi:hypothetical protein|nr:hypothetical protein [Acidimicrobiales bacterium]
MALRRLLGLGTVLVASTLAAALVLPARTATEASAGPALRPSPAPSLAPPAAPASPAPPAAAVRARDLELAAAAALRPPAPPPSPPPEEAASDPASAGSAALALIRYPWDKLGYQVAFLGPRAGFKGMTWCQQHRIEVYVSPGEPLGLVAFVTAYELAHAVDCTYMTAASRAAWATLRGFSPSTPWFPPCTCSEDAYGSGDFADVFATWLVGPGWWPWRSALAPAPTPAQVDALMPELFPPALR